MSVAHAAFYCFRKMEIMRSEGGATMLDHHLFQDQADDEDAALIREEDEDSYDSIEAEIN